MPTNPINPAAETAAAAPSDAAAITIVRTAMTGRPRDALSSSPTASTSRSRAQARHTMTESAMYGSTPSMPDHVAPASEPSSQ